MQNSIFTAFLSALSLSQLVAAQDRVPLPDNNGNGDSGVNTCGGCYVVADVAGIAFGAEVITVTQSNNVIIASGANGSVVTTTATVTFNEPAFTLTSGAGAAATPASPAANTAPAQTSLNSNNSFLTISGVTLTSPTAYNLFTAFATTRTTLGSDGSCSIVLGSKTNLLSAFSVPIPATITDEAGLLAFQTIAEQSFISEMGIPSCSAGGETSVATTHFSITTTTTSMTTTLNRTLTPAMATVATTPSSTVVSTTAAPTPTVSTFIPLNPIFSNSSVTFVTPSSGQSVIVLGPTSSPADITAATASIAQSNDGRRESPLGALFSGAFIMIMGLFA